jgi:DNA-binding GntR family transcriptional regulator
LYTIGSGPDPIRAPDFEDEVSIATMKQRQSSQASAGSEPHRGHIVDGILKGIFNGRYAPGDRLVTDRLAKEFRVSQTPIREAIRTLAGMGVLVVKPNCGAIVRRFTPKEVRDICQVRRKLEVLAIGSACGRVPASRCHALRDQLAIQSRMALPIGRREIEQVKRTDTLLHDAIRQATRNRFLADELNRIMVLVRAIRDAAWNRLLDQRSPDLSFVIEEAKEHLEIVDALLANNMKLAQRALNSHLISGARYIVRAVEE